MIVKKQFKALIERNHWFKAVPNALTLCNSICGFGAILYTLGVYSSPRGVTDVFAISAWIILFAMVFDALDGFAARIFNAASMKGIQMDSLADMVTFGVAPAAIVAIMAHHLQLMPNWQYLLICGLAAVYLGGAALRLATYNVHAMLEKKSGEKFAGLPTPGGAAAICSIVIFCNTNFRSVNYLVFALPIYAAILGGLMVSSIPYMHVGKWLFSIRRNKQRLIVFAILFLTVCVFKIAALVALINIYVFSGPAIMLWNKLKLVPDAEKSCKSRTA
ncbi:MAG: CDP-alcohol phosphatidyltransferase family protein [Victivallales bacterium]|nr:CDP-alcohol phosphatidyltransferase family protein [Victivallales bacterium]